MGDPSGGGFSAVVIDGYNLINRVPELAGRLASSGLEAARSYALGWLRRYQAVRRRRVVLVLDGPRPGRSDFGLVEVLYSASADDAVVRAAGPGTLVVTSDRARAAGAGVLSSEEFWRAMTAGASPAGALYSRSSRRRGRGRDDGDGDDEDDEARGPARRNRKLTKREKRRRRETGDLLRRV